MPEHIQVIREVTSDRRYSNYQIAHEIPEEE